MSKLDDLINELCPDGVDFKPLYQVTTWDKKFKDVPKEKQPNKITFNHISADELKKLECDGSVILLSTGKYNGTTTIQKAGKNLNNGEVIAIPSGGNANVKYCNGAFVDSGNILATTNQNTKYIFYVLQSKMTLLQTYFRGSGIKHPSMVDILDIEIPIPPLPVQEEIVRILDSFTELTAELTAELTERKKQYEYYRDTLLTFDDSVVIKKLDKVSDIIDCLHSTPKYSDDGYPIIRVMDVKGKYINVVETLKVTKDTYNEFIKRHKPVFNDIVVSRVGSYGNFALVPDNDVCLGQNVAIIHAKDINPLFLYYWLNSKNIKKLLDSIAKGGGYKNIGIADIKNIDIPCVSLEEQERVVSILDRFDKLCNDISEGLPAEIEARQKQYEYYRDKLLTFKRKEN